VAYAGAEKYPFKILMSHDPSHWDAEVRPNILTLILYYQVIHTACSSALKPLFLDGAGAMGV
jgi:hypothetical protein